MTNNEQIILLKVKSLLNNLEYIIKDGDIVIVEKFHKLCRKYCKLEINNEVD